jgi:YidC/Oxa1 family membrane protein insertase
MRLSRFKRGRSLPSPLDLLAALAMAIVAFSFVMGPVLGQDASSSPAATASPTSSPTPIRTADSTPTPSPAVTSGTLPAAAATALATPTPSAAGLAAGASPTATASPVAQYAPGSSTTGDPCAPTPTPNPNATPGPSATTHPNPNLCPAQPDGANPLSLLAWAFTPVFQVIFIGLVALYNLTGDIGTAIILLTIIMRTLLIPVFRAQIVSQRRMQMLQPELRAIQQRYKGDRAKISEQQMLLYRERGINPASGCLPAVLQLVLLLPMYQVFMQGLKAPDISSMLHPFGIQVVSVQCMDPGNPYVPCINPDIPWLAWLPKIDNGFQMPGYPGGLPSNQPEIFVIVLAGMGLGLSLLALVSALLQLVQTRMMMNRGPSADATQSTQNRLFLLMPAFSLIYGAILPAGLFIYWITTTIFSIVQQFLINGYGGLFPLFGWTPGFARDYQPRFPVSMPAPKPASSSKEVDITTTTRSASESAAGTIRPVRRRSRRRGRRR